ncbi:hypothetical protein FOMPIDRAFT_1048074 [Fomitopsis schrenkii]|uniref:Uncharacterized protein n=1 Tax=Fomitopsis schrenkii TaxID=2126942 RepID=S8FUZ4_FOMSC|nr:hypothetical protein FOMPIDRAFT_1048074 [Fomitopsis schrenkii]
MWESRPPEAARAGQPRVAYLAQLSNDPRYKAVYNAWVAKRPTLDSLKTVLKPTKMPMPLLFASWATWRHPDAFMPKEVHCSPNAANNLIMGVRTKPWMARGVIDWAVVEQVLLAVGLALRDIHTAHFPRDPDDPPPAEVPYLANTQWNIQHAEELLDTLQLLLLDIEGRVNLFDGDMTAASDAPEPSTPRVEKDEGADVADDKPVGFPAIPFLTRYSPKRARNDVPIDETSDAGAPAVPQVAQAVERRAEDSPRAHQEVLMDETSGAGPPALPAVAQAVKRKAEDPPRTKNTKHVKTVSTSRQAASPSVPNTQASPSRSAVHRERRMPARYIQS